MTTTARIRIYLVEDHPLVREGIRSMLQVEPDFIVTGETDNGEQALRDIPTLAVDIVLMDVGLAQGIGGVETLRRLKKIRPSLPVLMLTGNEGDAVMEALEAGAAGYILKTSPLRSLIQAVWAAIEGKRPIDPALSGAIVDSLSALKRAGGQPRLTPRQIKVLQLVADGASYQDIAGQLFMSVATVNREMRKVFDTLGAHDAVQAVAEGYRRQILS
ncbi:MAG: response regulator transcription factor [Dehalococcoidia bacterium]